MALKTFLFVVANLLSIYFSCSTPAILTQKSLSDFVLDDRKDCGLANHQDVIKIFKIVSCPSHVEIYYDNYFDQRNVLPCFGSYDALHNLCEFPSESISFVIPESFKDSKKFCTEAKAVYDHYPLHFSTDTVKKWGEALLSTMSNDVLCNNLCVMNNTINDQCIAMMTFAHEYIHLKETSGSITKPKSEVNLQLNDPTVKTKPTPDALTKESIDDVNTKKSSNPTNPSSGDSHPSTNKATDITTKETEKATQSSKSELKSLFHSDNSSAKLNLGVESPKIESAVETETPNEEIKPPVNEQSVKTFPVTGASSTLKVSPNIVDEGMNDGVDKTATEVDDIHGENEEIIPVEPREKENPDEETEKANEEEKNTAPDTEQHVPYQAGFNAIGDPISDSEDSYSFTYIVTTMAALCCVYLLFHYRNKLLALALEGRKGRSSRGRGRPSSANYSKLHSNLEEAIASNVTTPSATHVLY